MTRRNFLKQSIGGGALLSLATPAAAQGTTSLRLLATDAITAATLADQISAATGNTFVIETTIVPLTEAGTILDRVSSGEADMGLTALDHFMPKNLAFGLFASMPFGMAAGELDSWVLASDGGDMLAMLGDELGVTFRFAGDGGAKPIWSKEPLSDLSAFQAKSVGSTGLGLLNMQKVGVASVADLGNPSIDLNGLDILDGLSVVEMSEKGLTDFPHMTLANPNKPSAAYTLAISQPAYEGLSAGHRVVLERACSASMSHGRARNFHENAVALRNAGDTLSASPLPNDIWQALQKSAQSVLATVYEDNDIAATIVDSYVYFLTDIAAWSEIGEAAFYDGRKRLSSL